MVISKRFACLRQFCTSDLVVFGWAAFPYQLICDSHLILPDPPKVDQMCCGWIAFSSHHDLVFIFQSVTALLYWQVSDNIELLITKRGLSVNKV